MAQSKAESRKPKGSRSQLQVNRFFQALWQNANVILARA